MRYGFFDNPNGLVFPIQDTTTIIDLRNLPADLRALTYFVTVGDFQAGDNDFYSAIIVNETEDSILEWVTGRDATGLILKNFPLRGNVALKIRNDSVKEPPFTFSLYGYYSFEDCCSGISAMRPLSALQAPGFQNTLLNLTAGATNQIVGSFNAGDLLTLSISTSGDYSFTYTPTSGVAVTFADSSGSASFAKIFQQVPVSKAGTLTVSVAANAVISGYIG